MDRGGSTASKGGSEGDGENCFKMMGDPRTIPDKGQMVLRNRFLVEPSKRDRKRGRTRMVQSVACRDGNHLGNAYGLS